jgi:hypothetical protein
MVVKKLLIWIVVASAIYLIIATCRGCCQRRALGGALAGVVARTAIHRPS